MDGRKRMDATGGARRWLWVGLLGLGLGLTGCRTTGAATKPDGTPNKQVVAFDPVTVTADLELDRLNDEELFAGGTSAFAANDFKQAARYFGRLVDFHPNSPHRRQALYNAGLAHQRLKEWDDAYGRFSELAEPAKDPHLFGAAAQPVRQGFDPPARACEDEIVMPLGRTEDIISDVVERNLLRSLSINDIAFQLVCVKQFLGINIGTDRQLHLGTACRRSDDVHRRRILRIEPRRGRQRIAYSG